MMKTNQSATINVLDGKFVDYKGKIDIDYFTGEVVNYTNKVFKKKCFKNRILISQVSR